jgi:hypothetical protein
MTLTLLEKAKQLKTRKPRKRSNLNPEVTELVRAYLDSKISGAQFLHAMGITGTNNAGNVVGQYLVNLGRSGKLEFKE